MTRAAMSAQRSRHGHLRVDLLHATLNRAYKLQSNWQATLSAFSFALLIAKCAVWYLPELMVWLCAYGWSRFFLTTPLLRIPGGVGFPVTRVASV